MPLEQKVLETLVLEAFPDADIALNDLAGDDDHWSLTITSAAFIGKSRIEQHKMVYAALQGTMGNELHALQLKTRTPDN